MKMVLDAPLQLQPGAVTLVVDASPTFEPLVISEEVPEVPVVGHEFEAYADTVDEGWGYTYFRHRVTVDLENRPGERDDYMVFVEYGTTLKGRSGTTMRSGLSGSAFGLQRWMPVFAGHRQWGGQRGAHQPRLGELGRRRRVHPGRVLPLRVERPTPSLANHFNSVQAYYGALDNPSLSPRAFKGTSRTASAFLG